MRGDTIERAFEIIRMFESGPVTTRLIQDRLGIKRLPAARWIDQASRFMPIIEDGLDHNGRGRPCRVYRLLKKGE